MPPGFFGINFSGSCVLGSANFFFSNFFLGDGSFVQKIIALRITLFKIDIFSLKHDGKQELDFVASFKTLP